MEKLKKCLIVVDYQNDFVNGALGFPGAVKTELPIAGKINRYRERGDVILFTFDTHGENYLETEEGKNLPVAHCLRGTHGHKLYGKAANLIGESDRQFYKNTFGSHELYMYLRTRSFESIELCGLVSNICVLANAVLAKTAQPDTPVFVCSKATASYDENLNRAALEVMAGMHIHITEE
jgi:nicotinamidase-related amidase